MFCRQATTSSPRHTRTTRPSNEIVFDPLSIFPWVASILSFGLQSAFASRVDIWSAIYQWAICRHRQGKPPPACGKIVDCQGNADLGRKISRNPTIVLMRLTLSFHVFDSFWISLHSTFFNERRRPWYLPRSHDRWELAKDRTYLTRP